MKSILNFGIIGVGRFGKNYLRTLNEMDEVFVKWICSSTEKTLNDALSCINLKYQIKKTTNYKKILDDKSVDAVVISTPGSTHYKIAKDCLNSGKHILVEKPFCLKSKEAQDLLKISKNKKKICMVGHLHMFNPGIQKIREDMKAGLFGKINYISAAHFGNGPVRNDMGAIWDFFPHSASIFLYLLGRNPLEISMSGASFMRKGIEDIAVMNLKFPNNVFATSTCSWLHPQKKMEVVVAGKNLYAVFDDYAIDKLKYFDSEGAKKIPINDSKPLAEQAKYFIGCIKNNKTPINDAENGFKVTRILELGQHSMNQNKPLKISGL